MLVAQMITAVGTRHCLYFRRVLSRGNTPQRKGTRESHGLILKVLFSCVGENYFDCIEI